MNFQRNELEVLKKYYDFANSFEVHNIFEDLLSEYTGAPYVVLTDSCTHGIELILRLLGSQRGLVPYHTYISIPFTLMKLKIDFTFHDDKWSNWYWVDKGNKVIDAAAVFYKNMFIPDTFMCLSFQYKKAIPIGRGGAILLSDKHLYNKLKKMSYDGRNLSLPWAADDISEIGYHYYMTPEDAARGVLLLKKGVNDRHPSYLDYPDLRKFKVFKEYT